MPAPLFQKGTSGNPGGMSKELAELRRLCRGLGKEALETLVDLMKSADDEKVRLEAAKTILSRGGLAEVKIVEMPVEPEKPIQAQPVNVDDVVASLEAQH
jgi:hypothetical protein